MNNLHSNNFVVLMLSSRAHHTHQAFIVLAIELYWSPMLGASQLLHFFSRPQLHVFHQAGKGHILFTIWFYWKYRTAVRTIPGCACFLAFPVFLDADMTKWVATWQSNGILIDIKAHSAFKIIWTTSSLQRRSHFLVSEKEVKNSWNLYIWRGSY